MKQWFKDEFWYLYQTFHDSEVILWSRFQVLLGTIWVALQGVDVSPIITNPKWLVYWVIFSNLVNEALRRRHAEYDEHGSIR
jgi:hypothetical protein